MSDDPIPDSHTVFRYIGASKRDGDLVHPEGFRDSHISVNWLECREGTKEEQISRVRRLVRLKRGAGAVFAELNIGEVRSCFSGVDVVKDPMNKTEDWPEAPCHAEIVGLPENEVASSLVFERLADIVVQQYPARFDYE